MKLKIVYHYFGSTEEYVTKCADIEDVKYFLENIEADVTFDELSIEE